MMNYISTTKKRLVGRNNQTVSPMVIDYSTVETVQFQLVDPNNQLIDIDDNLSGLYFAGSLQTSQPSYDLLFLSKDYTISANVISFSVDTYTVNFLNKIKKQNTDINIEIGQQSLDAKKVWMRDHALANPRVYVAGLSPAEIDSKDYYTKTEVDEKISGISGVVTKEYVDAADNYLSGQIDLKASNADLDEHTLNTTIHVTAEDKTAWNAKASTTYVDAQDSILSTAIDTKAAQTDLTTHTSDTVIHVTSDDKTKWNGKQDAINAENKLDYAYISGTPTIPTKTSDLTNDSDFQTSTQVGTAITTAISGKADKSEIPTKTSDLTNDSDFTTTTYVDGQVSGKQDAINAENKLDYAYLSGTPEIPTVNDATITITQGGVSKGTFTTNQATAGTIALDGDSIIQKVETKRTTTAGTFEADLNDGKAIQKYSYLDATSGTITITAETITSLATDEAMTCEIQIPTNGNVTTINIPATITTVDLPDSLEYLSGITYQDFVVRGEKDMNGNWKTYLNYAYSFVETITE